MGFDAHLTLIFTGEMEPEEESLVKEIVYEASYKSYMVERKEIAMFGPEKNIPVIKVLDNLDLHSLRERLLQRGVRSASEYSWNPHITLRLDHAQTLRIPRFITLGELDLY